MKTLVTIASAAAVGFAACPAAMAQAPGKPEYLEARKTIESDFRTAKMGCEPMLGNVRTICMADVRGREVVALAELRAAHYPTDEALMEVRILKARAALAVARARCEDVPAHRKADCVAEAETEHVEQLRAPAAAPK